jgi:hypothetical protein
MNNRYIVDETIAILTEAEYKYSVAESTEIVRKFDLDPLYQALDNESLLIPGVSKEKVIDILFPFTGSWGSSEVEEIAAGDISADIVDMALALDTEGLLVED